MDKTAYRTALIVGTGPGLSASLARLFAKNGLKVALAARRTDKLAALCAETGGYFVVNDKSCADADTASVLSANSPLRSQIKAIAFDGFVIFDPKTVFVLADELFLEKGSALSNEWRTRQFEYTWLRVASQPDAVPHSGSCLAVPNTPILLHSISRAPPPIVSPRSPTTTLEKKTFCSNYVILSAFK